MDVRPDGTPWSDLVVVLAMILALAGAALTLVTGGR